MNPRRNKDTQGTNNQATRGTNNKVFKIEGTRDKKQGNASTVGNMDTLPGTARTKGTKSKGKSISLPFFKLIPSMKK